MMESLYRVKYERYDEILNKLFNTHQLQTKNHSVSISVKYSKIVGLWQTEIGQPNEVSHLWVYPDLNARTDARARLGQDESWRDFQGKGRPYLRELNNVLLQPTNFSPLK